MRKMIILKSFETMTRNLAGFVVVFAMLLFSACGFGNGSNPKIKPLAQGLGEQGFHLSVAEFTDASYSHDFPILPDSASDISYAYQYDGFLPDYRLEITFQIPCELPFETYTRHSGEFNFWQTVEEKDDFKIVHYLEILT